MQRGRKKRNASAATKVDYERAGIQQDLNAGPPTKVRKVEAASCESKALASSPEDNLRQQGFAAASSLTGHFHATVGSDKINLQPPMTRAEPSREREGLFHSQLASLLQTRSTNPAPGLPRQCHDPFATLASHSQAMKEHSSKQMLVRQILDRSNTVENLLGGLNPRLFQPSLATRNAPSLPSLSSLSSLDQHQHPNAASRYAQEYYSMALRQAQAYQLNNAAAIASLARSRSDGSNNRKPDGSR